MEAANREGSQRVEARLSTLMIDTPGDLVWDLPCMQQDSYVYLERGPLMWMLPLYPHVNQKSGDDDDDDDKIYVIHPYYNYIGNKSEPIHMNTTQN